MSQPGGARRGPGRTTLVVHGVELVTPGRRRQMSRARLLRELDLAHASIRRLQEELEASRAARRGLEAALAMERRKHRPVQ